jgi:hypothetical protein
MITLTFNNKELEIFVQKVLTGVGKRFFSYRHP